MDSSIRKIKVSVANNRKSKQWKEKEYSWNEFTALFVTPKEGTESFSEYMALSKDKQDELKDVGGFVGGTLKGNTRKATDVLSRELITLDLDNIPGTDLDSILDAVEKLGYAALLYSTRKHTKDKPRLRILFPLAEPSSVEEYEPLARMLASQMGIDYADPTTFEANRLMYFPSICKGADYLFKVFTGEPVKKEEVLGLYRDWQNVSEWPTCKTENLLIRKHIAKQGNPLEKNGLIGAFCKTYDIPSAISKFLKGIYVPTDKADRWTYADGSTTGGAVLYDNDTFLYSHHATDPCSGILVNAFDLVRIHKFGDLDESVRSTMLESNRPSFKEMEKLVMSDSEAMKCLHEERILEAQKAFEEDDSEHSKGEIEKVSKGEVNTDWMNKLLVNEEGRVLPTIDNFKKVMENDHNLKGKIYSDSFTDKKFCGGAVPWDKSGNHEWTDEDDNGLFWYLELFYKIHHEKKANAALSLVFKDHRINVVADYLNALRWDGKSRAERLFIDYLGAEDCNYTKEITLKTLEACVIRAFKFGAKYDNMLILVGAQGIGKSTILKKLGKEWFTDSLVKFSGKEAEDTIAGKWIVEVSELTALNRQESTEIKQFLSTRSSNYRESYARRSKEHPRKCVFFGTSNEDEFLKDTTGNRRFYPLPVDADRIKKDIWNDLTEQEVDQIWAEICFMVSLCDGHYDELRYQVLSKESTETLAKMHEEYSEKDPYESLVERFSEIMVPSNWLEMDLLGRRMYLDKLERGESDKEDSPLMPMPYLSAQNIHCEMLRLEISSLKKQESNRYNKIIKQMKGWKKSTVRDVNYGKQRCYRPPDK